MAVDDGDGGLAQQLLRLTTDADCFRTLILLNDRPAAVDEIANALGIDADAAAGHVAKLQREALVEERGEAPNRDGFVPRYRAVAPTIWTDEDWEALSIAERARLTRWTIEWIASDANHAVDAGSFARRADTHVSRTVSPVDERGWEELTRIQSDSLQAILDIQAESAERLAERGEEGMPVMSAMICCELPMRNGSVEPGQQSPAD